MQKRTNPVYRFVTLLCFAAALIYLAPAQAQTAPTRGWQPLINVLDALTPKIDTSLALTPKDITDRITQMLNNGQNQEALEAIQKRLKEREDNAEINVDVQLLFLQGRAQSQLGLSNEAIESYRQLTIFYPELPEPWNNLAAEYMRQNKLGLAREALDMALLTNPNYKLALKNQGELQLMLAHESFRKAGDAERSEETQYILQP